MHTMNKFIIALLVMFAGQYGLAEETVIHMDLVLPEGSEHDLEDYEPASLDQLSLQVFSGNEQIGVDSMRLQPLLNERSIVISDWSSLERVTDKRYSERLDIDNIDMNEVRIMGRLSVFGTRAFPYRGHTPIQEITYGEENTWRIEMRLANNLLPREPADVTLRVMSTVTGEPLPGVNIRVSSVNRSDHGRKHGTRGLVTGDDGEITVHARNILRGLDVRFDGGASARNGEQLSAHVPYEKIKRYLADGASIEVWTNPGDQIVRLVIRDEDGEEKLFPYKGPMLIDHPMELSRQGPTGSRRFAVYFRSGVAARYRKDGRLLPGMELLRHADITFRNSTIPVRALRDQIRIEQDAERDIPLYIIPIEVSPRVINMTVNDAESGAIIPQAKVTVKTGGGERFHEIYQPDDSGRMVTSELPWEKLYLTIAAPGYQAREKIVSVNDDRQAWSFNLIPMVEVTFVVDGHVGAELSESVMIVRRPPEVPAGVEESEGDIRWLPSIEQHFRAERESAKGGDDKEAEYQFAFSQVIVGDATIFFKGSQGELLAQDTMAINESGLHRIQPAATKPVNIVLNLSSFSSPDEGPEQAMVSATDILDMQTMHAVSQRLSDDPSDKWYPRTSVGVELPSWESLRQNLHARVVPGRIGVVVWRVRKNNFNYHECTLIDIIDTRELGDDEIPELSFNHGGHHQWYRSIEELQHSLQRER